MGIVDQPELILSTTTAATAATATTATIAIIATATATTTTTIICIHSAISTTSKPHCRTRTMRTATPGFESALHTHHTHHHHSHLSHLSHLSHQPVLITTTTGSALDTSVPEQRLKHRLHKIIRIPSNVAQTHSRMTPIKLSISRLDRRKPLTGLKLNPSLSSTPDALVPIMKSNSSSVFVAESVAQPTSTATVPIMTATTAIGIIDRGEVDEGIGGTMAEIKEENSMLSLNLGSTLATLATTSIVAADDPTFLRGKNETQHHHHGSRNSSSSSGTKHDIDVEDSSDDKKNKGYDTQMAPPREGFTVSTSLFARVKARVLQQSSPKQSRNQRSTTQKQSSPEESRGSNQEENLTTVSVKGSKIDSAEVESNASHSNPNTLSSGTNHFNDCVQHDQDRDSDSTATDLEDITAMAIAAASSARFRQRKYSFGPHYNAVVMNPNNNSHGDDDYNSGLDHQMNKSSIIDEWDTSALTKAEHAMAELIITEEIMEEREEDEVILINDLADKEQDPVQLFEQVLTRHHLTEEAITASLQELRQLILAFGIPDQPKDQSKSSLIRGKCWKLLLEVHHVSAQEYVSLVKQGKPEEYDKIRNDTFRTLATDRKFTDVVEEDSLIRVLCAFAWSTQATTALESDVSFTYVQGMNVLAAPFLYTMSEMEAFYSYSNLIRYCCPLYVQPALQGVHCGTKLLEECLRKIDNELYEYLKSKNLSAEVYAFPSVLTLCACTPPLEQALQLWDFLLAWGIHLNIICIIAQLYLIRDELLSHASPMKLLRIFPDLDADKIIRETIRMIKLLPDELYDLLVRHPYDPTVAEQINW